MTNRPSHHSQHARVWVMPSLRALIYPALLLTLAGCSDSSDTSILNDDLASAAPDVTVASLNALHGGFCPPETQGCRVADRLDLLFDWLETIDCPDVVLLQEILGDRIIALLHERAAVRCGGSYHVLAPALALGQNYTLTRYPPLQTAEDVLVGGIRNLFHVQLDHPSGPVDVFNTHLAAGIDRRPCDDSCPEACLAANVADTRECQAIQVAMLTEQRAAPGSLRILGGDFNADPASFEYLHLVEGSAWVDAYLTAGNPECDATTGIGCTSGRESEGLGDMESAASGVRRRIDYIFLHVPSTQSGSSCQYVLDSRQDDDGDGLATGLFADDPNPFVTVCGSLPHAICWPSDHEGMQADINCR
ncbi:MAG: endonuclease/exonuclease/phosphatase family protein [Halioglobus sp.]|nr:endonuclease/exonuclease/phosphatase family protein [Halioglobus sp.]